MDANPLRITTERAVEKFVAAEWSLLARLGYENYRQSGRGFLFIDGFEETKGRSTVYYHTSVQDAGLRSRLEETGIDLMELTDAVLSYCPEKSIIFVHISNLWGTIYSARQQAPSLFEEVRRLSNELGEQLEENGVNREHLMSVLDLPAQRDLAVLKIFELDPSPADAWARDLYGSI